MAILSLRNHFPLTKQGKQEVVRPWTHYTNVFIPPQLEGLIHREANHLPTKQPFFKRLHTFFLLSSCYDVLSLLHICLLASIFFKNIKHYHTSDQFYISSFVYINRRTVQRLNSLVTVGQGKVNAMHWLLGLKKREFLHFLDFEMLTAVKYFKFWLAEKPIH